MDRSLTKNIAFIYLISNICETIIQKDKSVEKDIIYVEALPGMSRQIINLQKGILKDIPLEGFHISAFKKSLDLDVKYLIPDSDLLSPNFQIKYNMDLVLPYERKINSSCLYRGTIDTTYSPFSTYKPLFNLCNGIRGNFIYNGYDYKIQPKVGEPFNNGLNQPIFSSQYNSYFSTPYEILRDHTASNDIPYIDNPITNQDYWNFIENHNPNVRNMDEIYKGPYILELAIFVHQIDGHPNIDEILSIADMASQLFKVPSFHNDLTLSLERIEFIDAEKVGLMHKDSELSKLLKQFTKYSKNLARTMGSYPWDLAVFIPGYGRDYPLETLGIAYNPGVCTESRTLVSRFTGLGSYFTLTHEIGHSLGSSHDAISPDIESRHDSYCRNPMLGIMASGLEMHKKEYFKWSPCSTTSMINYLRMGASCLMHQQAIQNYLQPGTIYTPDQQCQLKHGPLAVAALIESNCDTLICKLEDSYEPGPTINRTPCVGSHLSHSYTSYECRIGVCRSLYDIGPNWLK